MNTDPIADFLIRLQNAAGAGKVAVDVPFSNFKLAIAKLLEENNYLKIVPAKSKTGRKILHLELAKDGSRFKLQGVERLSKVSRRVYEPASNLRLVKRGHGLLVVSTSQGLMTGTKARQAGLGGELLFKIW